MIDSFDELRKYLLDSAYYIAHNLITRKGKVSTFRGCLFMAAKDDIVRFLDGTIKCGDMREFLLSPPT